MCRWDCEEFSGSGFRGTARPVPIRALALRADLRVLILVAWEPLVFAALAAIAPELDLRHVAKLPQVYT
jgi:hypothetical protein